jgi:hypothetical protein
MPVYECTEHQFVENLRKILDTNFKIIVKRSIKLYDDAKHNISRLPDCEFEKFSTVISRKRQRSNAYAKVPFYDEFHRRFYSEDEKVHSARYSRMVTLSIPYFKVEHSYDIWGETFCYNFDALFQPEVRLDSKICGTNKSKRGKSRKKMLVHVLYLNPPHHETCKMELPRSVLLFDINQKLKK